MSEQVIGVVMTYFLVGIILTFMAFFCGEFGFSSFWTNQASNLGWIDPQNYTNVIRFSRNAIFIFLNAARESVM